jgi:N-acetylmuramoyl-L-alanine amidase
MRKVNHIIVHHSVSNWGDGEVVKGWHMNPKPQGNGWGAPGYHVVVCNGFPNYNSWHEQAKVQNADGRVDRIWSEEKLVNGCKYANEDSLQVCLIGNFDVDKPTEMQMQKLIDLLKYWCEKYKLKPATDIFGHGEMQIKIGKEGYHKTCPGKNVSMDNIRSQVAMQLVR